MNSCLYNCADKIYKTIVMNMLLKIIFSNKIRLSCICTWLFFLSVVPLNAQEYITGLSGNPALLNSEKKYTKKLKSSTSTGDTIELPFVDDFSSTTVYPDASYWKDSCTYINSAYPVNPVSIGVATLDAINLNGKIYGNASSDPFYADTLTSNPINLTSSLQNVVLSFFYQAGGIGDNPDEGDSLTLDFYRPDSSQWYRIWAIPGESVSSFKQVLMAVDQSYYQKGFRFRFRNIASLDASDAAGRHGNADMWHIDYVRLGANRSLTDTTLHDVAIVAPLTSLIKTYYSMPWAHFEKAYRTVIKSTIEVVVKNNDSITRFIKDPKFEIQEITDSDDGYSTETYGLATNITSGSTDSISADLSNPFQPNNIISTIQFQVKSILTNDTEDLHTNDTATFTQIFSNYLAYDDGSGEAGYGINGEGSENAMVAYKYYAYKVDTLEGLSFYFNPTENDTTESYYLTLAVWADNNGKPGTLLYEETSDEITPKIGSLNQFYTFKLDSGIILSVGNFYIGWIQTEDAFLNIGFDLNNDNKAKLFYNLTGTWEGSSIEGTLMLHPIFGDTSEGFITGTDDGEVTTETFSVYPNPASDQLTIQTGLATSQTIWVKIYDITGKTLMYEQLEDTTLDVSNLPNGLYILQLSGKNITFAPVKFTIQR
jgi:hypothetical protein